MNASPGTLHEKEWLRPQEAAELLRARSVSTFYEFLKRARRLGHKIKPKKNGETRSAAALYSRTEIEDARDAMGGRS